MTRRKSLSHLAGTTSEPLAGQGGSRRGCFPPEGGKPHRNQPPAEPIATNTLASRSGWYVSAYQRRCQTCGVVRWLSAFRTGRQLAQDCRACRAWTQERARLARKRVAAQRRVWRAKNRLAAVTAECQAFAARYQSHRAGQRRAS